MDSGEINKEFAMIDSPNAVWKKAPNLKPIWQVKIHSGLLRKNFKAEFSCHKWFTVACRTILAFSKVNKEEPKRLVVTIKKMEKGK